MYFVNTRVTDFFLHEILFDLAQLYHIIYILRLYLYNILFTYTYPVVFSNHLSFQNNRRDILF